MKTTLLFTRLLTLASLIFLFSCSEENELSPVEPVQEMQDVSVKNGRLVFKDRTTFESYSTALGEAPEKTSVDTYLNATEKAWFCFYT